MKWKNILTETLHINYPFVQAPMLGVTTPGMVAAISNAGALGSLPIGGLLPDQALTLIQQTKSLTDKPFAVNVFANKIPSSANEDIWNAMQEFLEQFAALYELPYQKKATKELQFASYEDQVDILITENIPVVSFTFGVLDDEVIDALHKNGAQLAGTATSAEEARLLSDKGIDIITAQGIEAGGHRGSFLHKDIPQVGLMALLPQVVDGVDKPVLASGAIADGRGIKAAITLGALGVQVGSAFIACNESAANATYKEALQQTTGMSTTLTRSYTGRWLRCIKNEFIETIESSGLAINEYPVQQSLTAFLRTLYENKNAAKFLPMLTGQNVRKSSMKNAADIFMDMIREAEHLSVEA
jgi:nitronate monooxygenase